ncbi:Septum formation initiator [Actinopolyspora lacussalsi subsp. righensis]|uniref:Septum formation initiator n=1 Tax=Actinopolyspora righensis TaxID=995060 RepID=A0A1I7B8L1_9ACTN|nr:septum formation initiator family protein [Actinopolyspora righensis]SFT83471.1 Septum formation initiator [Actinopolyspora righensis]
MPTGRPAQRDRRNEADGTSRTRQSTRARRPRGDSDGRTAPRRRSGPRGARTPAGTGGAFKLSSTRRAAVLATLVCAMALSVSVPLRTYLGQLDELSDMEQREQQLSEEVQRLSERKAELSDPSRLEAEARERLGYVRPGETPYIVELPSEEKQQSEEKAAPESKPWYQRMWNTFTGEGK